MNEKNFLNCHKIVAKTPVIASKRGKCRTDKIGVFSVSGLVYLAIEPEFVKETMQEFFRQIAFLLQQTLSPAEAFYYASLIHLKLAHIHPLQDGNGRATRLLENGF
ncbi:Fic family protein [Adhaeribacter pallidiroseus]|uniref:Fido domain-containing protein n=1 Tax=Adhaeribacter pallidiroseus TaxID=2072847 RepID=A0A369QVK3_9BACT|nr:Fic family protein [Adhaeribacter pallidiroseus]RDC66208.1 hypothetical protein AHMF7616_04839 [Adhaeribacter pallidiroseus]